MAEKKESNKEAEEKIAELQLLEQNLQGLLQQKQQFQMELKEVDSALGHMKDAKKTYKIVANIMIDTKKEDLEKELGEKKEMLELRIKNLDTQEEKIKEKSEKLQKEVLGVMK